MPTSYPSPLNSCSPHLIRWSSSTMNSKYSVQANILLSHWSEVITRASTKVQSQNLKHKASGAEVLLIEMIHQTRAITFISLILIIVELVLIATHWGWPWGVAIAGQWVWTVKVVLAEFRLSTILTARSLHFSVSFRMHF